MLTETKVDLNIEDTCAECNTLSSVGIDSKVISRRKNSNPQIKKNSKYSSIRKVKYLSPGDKLKISAEGLWERMHLDNGDSIAVPKLIDAVVVEVPTKKLFAVVDTEFYRTTVSNGEFVRQDEEKLIFTVCSGGTVKINKI